MCILPLHQQPYRRTQVIIPVTNGLLQPAGPVRPTACCTQQEMLDLVHLVNEATSHSPIICFTRPRDDWLLSVGVLTGLLISILSSLTTPSTWSSPLMGLGISLALIIPTVVCTMALDKGSARRREALIQAVEEGSLMFERRTPPILLTLTTRTVKGGTERGNLSCTPLLPVIQCDTVSVTLYQWKLPQFYPRQLINRLSIPEYEDLKGEVERAMAKVPSPVFSYIPWLTVLVIAAACFLMDVWYSMPFSPVSPLLLLVSPIPLIVALSIADWRNRREAMKVVLIGVNGEWEHARRVVVEWCDSAAADKPRLLFRRVMPVNLSICPNSMTEIGENTAIQAVV
jgi:hypothetical protein